MFRVTRPSFAEDRMKNKRNREREEGKEGREEGRKKNRLGCHARS